MANPVGVLVQNTLFAQRRAQSMSNGGLSAGVNAIRFTGNANKAIKAIQSIDDSVIKTGFESVSNTLKATKIASSPIAKGVVKVSEFAAAASTPLICLTAVANTVQAEKGKRLDTAIQEGFGVAGMLTAEKYASKALYSEVVEKGLDNLIDKLPLNGKLKWLKPVVQAVGFVAASVMGYDAGKKVGTFVSEH